MLTSTEVDVVLMAAFVVLVVLTTALSVVDVALTDVDAILVEAGCVEVEVFFVEAGTEDDVAFTATATTFEELTTPLDTGFHNAAGVYTGMGILVPYPATPQAGLVGAVNPAGAAVEVTEVVNVARGRPVDFPAQYPVP